MMIILRGKYIDRSKEEVRGGEQCSIGFGWSYVMKGCLICPQFLLLLLLFLYFTNTISVSALC